MCEGQIWRTHNGREQNREENVETWSSSSNDMLVRENNDILWFLEIQSHQRVVGEGLKIQR